MEPELAVNLYQVVTLSFPVGNSLIQGLTVCRKEYGDYAIDVKVIKGLNNQT